MSLVEPITAGNLITSAEILSKTQNGMADEMLKKIPRAKAIHNISTHKPFRVNFVVVLVILAGVFRAIPTGPDADVALAQTDDPIFVGAGDIADCSLTQDESTAQLLDNISGTVFTLGDNVYPTGTTAQFGSCYGPTWGRHKNRTRPAPGNHDYNASAAAGYYGYFGLAASPLENNCTSNCKGYYSYNLGAWHIIALNSEISHISGSAQEQWLRADLAANQSLCTLAYWHKPRFSSGLHGNTPSVQTFWQALYDYGADVVLSGHDHTYERFAPQNPNGQADSSQGIREFVAGTGGAGLYPFASIQPNSQVRNDTTHGVLKLTLHATSYDWEFVPIIGQTFTDSGSSNCVDATRPAISGNIGVAGATISYVDGIARTAITQADGSYSFTVPDNWSGTVTPSKACYTFTPLNRSYINVTINQTVQDYTYTITSDPGCAHIRVSVAGTDQGIYGIPSPGSLRVNYAGIDNGPAQVVSTNVIPIVAGLRELWVQGGTSSSFQLMGLPDSQLSDTYWFPSYNNVTLNEQLRFGNVGASNTTVTVTIGGIVKGTYPLTPNQQVRVNYAGLDSGPVKVQSSGGIKIIAAIRDAWFAGTAVESFSQLMGLPSSQLSDTYWFPSYNNVTLNEQLRFGNVDIVDTNVTVTIGATSFGPYLLHPNEQLRVNYPGMDSGPVKVQGTSGVKIIAALREAYTQNGSMQSWIQLMGLPAPQLSDTYYFPAYDNVSLSGQLRFGNVDIVDTNVTVTIGATSFGPYLLHPSEQLRVNYPSVDGGPVVIKSSGGVKIIVTLRDALIVNGVVESFAQMMGLPGTPSTTYWFPSYNNVTLDEQLRIGVP